MSVTLTNFTNDERRITGPPGSFSVLEHTRDQSVAPGNAISEYYMSKMGVRRRQPAAGLSMSDSLKMPGLFFQAAIGKTLAALQETALCLHGADDQQTENGQESDDRS